MEKTDLVNYNMFFSSSEKIKACTHLFIDKNRKDQLNRLYPYFSECFCTKLCNFVLVAASEAFLSEELTFTDQKIRNSIYKTVKKSFWENINITQNVEKIQPVLPDEQIIGLA